MNPLNTLQATTPATGEYLSEQALSGRDATSQDTGPASQRLLEPQNAEREAYSVLLGGAAAGETLQPQPDHQVRQ